MFKIKKVFIYANKNLGKYIIRGFYNIKDEFATEKTFHSLVDTICESFRNDPTLNGLAEIVHTPIEVDYSTGKLGDVLCHISEIKLDITQRNIY